MKEKRFRISFVVLLVAMTLLAVIAESLYMGDFEYIYRTRRFNRILHEKENVMDECLEGLRNVLAKGEPHGSISANNLFRIAEQNEITILEYIDNKLVYWSDNWFDVPLVIDDTLYSKPIVFLQNGWFLPRKVEEGNEKIVGLLRIHTDYGFENDIIKNGFGKDFHIPPEAGISLTQDSSEYRISDSRGTFLFSLEFPGSKGNTYLIIFPLVFWAASLLFYLLVSIEIVRILADRKKYFLGIISFLTLFAALYISTLLFEWPPVIFKTGLFSHTYFSLNRMIPSLGHMIILSLFAPVFSYILMSYLPEWKTDKEKPVSRYIRLTLLFAAGIFLVAGTHYLFRSLIQDSNISFEPSRILDINLYSIAGFTSVYALLLTPLFFLIKVYRSARNIGYKKIFLSLFSTLVIFAAFFREETELLFPVMIFSCILLFSIWTFIRRSSDLFIMSVLFAVIFGIYSLIVITVYSEQKTVENLKIQTVAYSTDNDPDAEHILLDIWPEIAGDKTLEEMMDVDYFERRDFENIYTYLHEVYFDGYLGNFNINIVLCRNDEPLNLVSEGDYSENCFGFFEDRIKKYGFKLTGTDFYFIDNQAGRSYYLCRLLFNRPRGVINGLFVELYDDVNVFQPGYSELLLDKKFHRYAGLQDYSFAKYINGEIVLKSGEFPYNKTDDDYLDKSYEYRIFAEERYRHVLYRNGNTTVILSRPEKTIGDVVISFAYLFAYIFLSTYVLFLILRRPSLRSIRNLNFRQKLQGSFIVILLVSFLLVGIVVAFLTTRQYKTEHYENVKEKMNSIYLELDNELSLEKHLSTDWRNSSNSSLNELLIRLSNIFNTDINLYDLNGLLLATSRPEIFIRDLTSRRMNNLAFINLSGLVKSEYYQTERMGNMNYISVYVPFLNTENKVLAYLNIPYFRMQSLLAREISNLVVAVMNFTLLLILITTGFAVFISSRLTSAITLLSERLASVELGKKSEHLTYNGNDEIGELVRQYNNMVDELEQSARKLADSEREYAWREMAKQIAHEIKNPLTPMKLNVQQLMKSWKDNAPEFENKLESFTRNQIENIDNLSSIATAFSSFAKMPGTNPAEVNILEQINTTIELFKNSDEVIFNVRLPHESKIFIFADKEHLNGIFSNLFKNGIQSVPQGRQGIIGVELDVRGNKVVISVSDNGTGIPESLQKKMFTPNFTTKSSGMGLGLSIVKRYVEGANGRIWFESEPDRGTTFYIEFPLLYTVEKPGPNVGV